LQRYIGSTDLSLDDFQQLRDLAEQHAPVLVELLTAMEDVGATTGPVVEIQPILQPIASRSPVCGYIHLSAVPLIDELLVDPTNLSSHIFQRTLQAEIPAFTTVCSQALPVYLVPLLRSLRDLAVSPFVEEEGGSDECLNTPSEDTYSPFPLLPRVRELPQYTVRK
jgi:hypothetical protein